jgi:uncharacterized coiled-coil protein SlyX
MDLQSRVKWVNQTGYQGDLNDVLIEIHINDEGKDKESGILAWYDAVQHDQALQLAKDVTTSIEDSLDIKIEDIKQETEHPLGSIAILKATKPIGVLLECFYMDKKDDVRFLEDDEKVDELGKSIARGIANYLGVNFNNNINLYKSNKSKGKPVNKKQQPSQKETRKEAQKEAQKDSQRDSEKSNQKSNQKDNQKNNVQGQPKSMSNLFGSSSKPNLRNSPLMDSNSSFVNSKNQANQSGQNNQSNQYRQNSSNTSPTNSSSAFGNKKNMTREERKEMINKYYKKALGEEPEQSDLNYFLNIGISEEQFLKRVLDSQDHKDLVENAKKYDELKKKHDELETKFESTDRGLKDQRNVMERLNSLLLQKNRALSQLQKRVQTLTWRLEEYEAEVGKKPARVKYDRSMSEKIWDFFSRKLG